MKKILKTFLFILSACILAILSKIFLPSDVNEQDFDSILVLKFGFPLIASLYFLMIYTHNAVISKWFASKSELSNFQCGLRTGISFGLIYLVGMQEIVVEASPFSEWGLPFVLYQFVMGIGEALMAVLLSICVSCFVVDKKSAVKKSTFAISLKSNLPNVILITLFYFFERIILYKTGLISSDINTFPIPTYIWTAIFGFTLGICYCLLYSVIGKRENHVKSCFKICVFGVGLCWLGFNLFIAFIFKDSLGDILIRCFSDVVILDVSSIINIRGKHDTKN